MTPTEQPDDPTLREKYAEYRRMYSTDPDDRIWAAVAEAFDIAGDGARTLTALDRAKAINPEWGKHRLQLAKACLRSRDWTRAMKELDACADLDASGLDPSFFADNYLYYLGYAMFGAGRYKEAAEAWRGADNTIQFWRNPEPLKDFHLHRAWAHHLDGNFLDAIEAYRRGLVAPGPGDCSQDDDMDTDQVERSQDEMNPGIEPYMELAQAAHSLDAQDLQAVPYT